MVHDEERVTSGTPAQTKDGRVPPVISPEEMNKYIRIAGKPWHNRKKKVSLRRVKLLREVGFSLRQIARIYGTSETTIRRRLKGK